MKYIKNFKKFFEYNSVAPEKVVNVKELPLGSEVDVLNRFEKIYKDLPNNEKKEIDSYFK